MKHSPIFLAATLFCTSLSTTAARAGMIAAPPPGPARIANADAVIVGRVEAIEPMDIKVGNVNYRIAVVKITDKVRGVKGDKTLRIGFIPIEMPNPNVKGPIAIRTGGARPVQLTVGLEGLFILKKQENEKFYTIGGVIGYFINSDKNPGFEKDVQAAKATVKVMENPQASLKAANAEERLLAAAILLDKYRTYRGPKFKQEPIDAAESKLILQAIADADWKAQVGFNSLQAAPWQLFQRLGVGPKDGYAPQPKDYHAAMQTWLRANAEKYRIQRIVASDAK